MLISYSILRLFDRKKKNLTIMTFLKVLWIILKWWKCVCLHFGVLFVFTEQNYFSFLLCQVKYRFIASNADWSVLYWKKKIKHAAFLQKHRCTVCFPDQRSLWVSRDLRHNSVESVTQLLVYFLSYSPYSQKPVISDKNTGFNAWSFPRRLSVWWTLSLTGWALNFLIFLSVFLSLSRPHLLFLCLSAFVL